MRRGHGTGITPCSCRIDKLGFLGWGFERGSIETETGYLSSESNAHSLHLTFISIRAFLILGRLKYLSLHLLHFNYSGPIESHQKYSIPTSIAHRNHGINGRRTCTGGALFSHSALQSHVNVSVDHWRYRPHRLQNSC